MPSTLVRPVALFLAGAAAASVAWASALGTPAAATQFLQFLAPNGGPTLFSPSNVVQLSLLGSV